MQIEITEAAAQQIAKRTGLDNCALQLVFDAEGCGCAVSGVPQLWIISPASSHHLLQAASVPVPILYEKRHEVFFEDELKLDYRPDHLVFQLKSRQQIYNAGMSLIEKRTTAGGIQ